MIFKISAKIARNISFEIYNSSNLHFQLTYAVILRGIYYRASHGIFRQLQQKMA